MAQKVITIITDDLTGVESEDAQSHTIAVDGVEYEIDLSAKSKAKLDKALAPYLEVGRKVPGKRKTPRASKGTGPDLAKVREWARSNGYSVNARGRIPTEIMEAYKQAS